MTTGGPAYMAAIMFPMTRAMRLRPWAKATTSTTLGLNSGTSFIIKETSVTRRTQLYRIWFEFHERRGVPDWNTYALIATIEEGRRNNKNPDVPDDLRRSYEEAWQRLVEIGLRELEIAQSPELISSIIATIAMGKGQFNLGRFAILFDESERENMLSETGWGLSRRED
jgi:hypothetical protein